MKATRTFEMEITSVFSFLSALLLALNGPSFSPVCSPDSTPFPHAHLSLQPNKKRKWVRDMPSYPSVRPTFANGARRRSPAYSVAVLSLLIRRTRAGYWLLSFFPEYHGYADSLPFDFCCQKSADLAV